MTIFPMEILDRERDGDDVGKLRPCVFQSCIQYLVQYKTSDDLGAASKGNQCRSRACTGTTMILVNTKSKGGFTKDVVEAHCDF